MAFAIIPFLLYIKCNGNLAKLEQKKQLTINYIQYLVSRENVKVVCVYSVGFFSVNLNW